MEAYTKIKTTFDEIGKDISEKQKLYIENARRTGGGGKQKRGYDGFVQYCFVPNLLVIRNKWKKILLQDFKSLTKQI